MNKKDFKRIWHIGAWNRNIGDWAAGFNLHRMLEQQAIARDKAVSFYLVDSQRSVFHDALVEHLNDDADLLLIGAGGMIFNRPQDQSVSGWAFNIPAQKLKEISVPIVVYGIGYNRFYFDNNEWPPATKIHLKALQEKAEIFSVRNNGSRNMLHKVFGFNIDSIEIVPDPGMKLFDRYIEIPGLSKDGPVIGVNWAGDRPHERFPEPWEKNRAYFINNLRNALQRISKEENARILYIPHLQDVDVDFFEELKAGFPNGTIFSLYEQLPHLYPPAGEILYHHVPFFTNVYRQMDLVLGMRGHSCIFSFGAGTKFIPIGSHNKVKYFTEDTGVPDYSIRMIKPEVETEEYMYKRISDCLHDQQYKNDLSKLCEKQFNLLFNINERIIDLLEKE